MFESEIGSTREWFGFRSALHLKNCELRPHVNSFFENLPHLSGSKKFQKYILDSPHFKRIPENFPHLTSPQFFRIFSSPHLTSFLSKMMKACCVKQVSGTKCQIPTLSLNGLCPEYCVVACSSSSSDSLGTSLIVLFIAFASHPMCWTLHWQLNGGVVLWINAMSITSSVHLLSCLYCTLSSAVSGECAAGF